MADVVFTDKLPVGLSIKVKGVLYVGEPKKILLLKEISRHSNSMNETHKEVYYGDF